jgi:hypothetical protein
VKTHFPVTQRLTEHGVEFVDLVVKDCLHSLSLSCGCHATTRWYHNKPTPFRIATKRSPIATQLQHIVTNCISLLQQVMRHSDLRVSLQLYIFVAIGSVAIDYVAIELLQLTML